MSQQKLFKSLFAIGLLFPIIGYGQATKAKPTGKKKFQKEIKTVYDYIDSVGIPEKYKNESVVIMGHYEKTKIIKPNEPFKVQGGEEQVSSNYVIESFGITRYALQDKNALEQFSTYYFNETENSKVGIGIIKKSGERQDLDMSKAISVSDEASIKYSDFNITLKMGKYKKIAVPGLEVGDMIEFNNHQFATLVKPKEGNERVYVNQNDYNKKYAGYSAASSVNSSLVFLFVLTYYYPQLVTTKYPKAKRTQGIDVPEFNLQLNSKYPCLKQLYEMTTLPEVMPFEYATVNGAPAPKISNKGEAQTLTIESSMNDAITSEYYMMAGNNIPTVRFTYNFKKYQKFGLHYNNTGAGFNEKNAADLGQRFVTQRWKANGINHFFMIDKDISRTIKKMSQKDKLKYLYYYYKRNYSLVTYIQTRRKYLSNQTSLEATKIFQLFCERYGISYDLLMYSPRQNGPTSTVVSGDKLQWGLVAHVDKENIYITDFDVYSEFNVPSRFMYGAEVFYVSPEKKYAVRKEVFSEKNSNNQLHVATTATVDLAGGGLKLNSTYTAGGETKTEYYGMINSITDYYKIYDVMLGDKTSKDEDEIDLLQLEYYSDDFRELEKQEEEKERLKRSFDTRLEQSENENFEAFAADDYHNEATVKKVNHNSHGISTYTSKEPEKLEFAIEYTLTETVQQVGESAIVVDLGKLITEQVEFSELEDRSRKYNIDLKYHQTSTTHIELAIPEGYQPANLDEFNVKVDNDLISFKSTAKIEKGKVVLETTKEYKKVHASAADWTKMMEAMDAAAHTFQRKMLFEKTNP